MNTTSIFLQTIIGGIGIGSLYALIALGYSMTFRSMGLVNFAQGSIYMVGTYFGIIWYRGMVLGLHVPYAAAFFIGLLCNVLLGLLLERIFRPLAKLDLMLMLLATIGLGFILDNLFTIIFGAEGFAVDSPLSNTPWKIYGIRVLPQMALLIGVSAVLMVGLQLFLSKTKLGMAMRASAVDYEIARTMGIATNRMNALALSIGCMMSAAAGILAAPIVYVAPSMGAAVGLKGFAAAILGGLGSIAGTFVGGLVMGLAQTLGGYFLGTNAQMLIAYLIVIVLLATRPQGLFGR